MILKQVISRLNNKLNSGFTLLELTLYMSLVSFVIIFLSSFTDSLATLSSQTIQDLKSEQSGLTALQALNYELNHTITISTSTLDSSVTKDMNDYSESADSINFSIQNHDFYISK